MRLVLSPLARRALNAMPKKDAEALVYRLERFAADPFASHPAAAWIKGHADAVRIRQGDWRAVCRIDRAADQVVIEAVGHRREIYR